ncbi:hypothetical protein RKD27_009294 [Streptomyces sp. SAI-126]
MPTRLRTALSSAVSALSVLALLTACQSSSTSAGSSGGKPVVGVDYPRSDTDFWNSYIKYTPQYGKELGLDLKTTNSQNDVASRFSVDRWCSRCETPVPAESGGLLVMVCSRAGDPPRARGEDPHTGRTVSRGALVPTVGLIGRTTPGVLAPRHGVRP